MFVGHENNSNSLYEIPDAALSKHVFVVGKTGTGKSTLMLNMMVQDIYAGRGLAFVDPHGDLAETLLRYVPKQRINDVVWIDPTSSHVPNLSLFEPNGSASGIVSAANDLFKSIWPDAWRERSQWFVENTGHTLMQSKRPAGIVGILKFILGDQINRQKLLEEVKDEDLKLFIETYERWTRPFRDEVVTPVLNKMQRLLRNEFVRGVIGAPRSSFKVREAMDNGKIILCKFPRGLIGKDGSALLSSLIVSKINNAALGRADASERRNFRLYVDEAGSALHGVDVHSLLSEGRKYGLHCVLATQELSTLDMPDRPILGAILGNCSTLIAYRVSAEDAVTLDREFYSKYAPEFYVKLDNFYFVLRTLRDQHTSEVQYIRALQEPPGKQKREWGTKVKQVSKMSYGVSREKTDARVNRYLSSRKQV